MIGNGPGMDHRLHKLTDDQILAIREAYASGSVTQTDLAAEYGITQSRVSLIVNGKAWAHISGPVLDSTTEES